MFRMSHLVAVALCATLVFSTTPAFGISTNFITAVSFANSQDGYVSGRYSQTMGFLSVTHDGGLTWSPVGISNEPVFSVYAWDASRAWAAGMTGAHVFKTTNAGASWSRSAEMADLSFPTMSGVAAFASDRVVATGWQTGSAGGTIGLVVLSVDGGATWSTTYAGPVYPPLGDGTQPITYAKMVAIDSLKTGSIGWVVGNEWNGEGLGSAYKRGLVFKTSDEGSTWTTQTAPAPTTKSLTCVTAASAQTAYAGGLLGYLIKTTDGGDTWTAAAGPFTGRQTVDITGIDSSGDSDVVVVGKQGLVGWSHNGGSSWTVKQMVNQKNLRGVSMLSATKWLVAGDDSTIYRTTNGGSTWSLKRAHKATLTSPYAASPIYHAKTRTWYGYVKPRHNAGGSPVKLTFERYSSGRYRAYASKYAKVSDYKTYSKYSASLSLRSTGKYRVRASDVESWHGSTYSSWRYFTVK